MELISVGLNHHTSPLEVREKTVVGESILSDALTDLRTHTGLDEAVIISTCNRFEIFSFGPAAKRHEIGKWACGRFGITGDDLKRYWYELHGSNVIHRLTRIACGLDSVIIGEPQILGQVKSAYQIARDNKHTQTVINRLFEHAISAAKEVRSGTGLGKHPISYVSITLDISKRLFENLAEKRALIIGVSEMTELAAHYFKENNVGTITIANRTPENAANLAVATDAEVADLANIEDTLHRYDIIVSCTASSAHILNHAMVANALKKRKGKPIHISDLALPRDIDPQVSKLEGVYLYTLDKLAKVISDNQRKRMRAGEEAGVIIDRRVEEFTKWLNARAAIPLIIHYRSNADRQCEQALTQALIKLRQGRDAETVMRELAHRIGKQLMHPATEIISAAGTVGNHELLKAIEAALTKADEQS